MERPIDGQHPKPPFYVDFIYHEHWQQHKEERGNYLPGLEMAVLDPINVERNLYYLGREYFWRGMHDKALKLFDLALPKIWWMPEKGQAYVWMALIYKARKDYAKASECLHKSIEACNDRREPWFELANLYEEQNMLEQAITYYTAALAVPFKAHGYMNDMALYGSLIPDRLAFAYNRMGNKEMAKECWIEAIKYI